MGEGDRTDRTRPLRADAQRNRGRLIAVAKYMFSEGGSETSLEAIAREAGVGIGTLYRHFPTRDTLIEAVYRTETQHLARAATRFSETLPPVEALRDWLRLFVDHIATKQVMSPVLASLVGGTSQLYAESGAGEGRDRITRRSRGRQRRHPPRYRPARPAPRPGRRRRHQLGPRLGGECQAPCQHPHRRGSDPARGLMNPERWNPGAWYSCRTTKSPVLLENRKDAYRPGLR